MAEEGQPSSIDAIKNNQQRLKEQIKQLEEGMSTPKAPAFQSEELREMVQTLIAQNKRLAEKVDYLLNILVEASSDFSEDVIDKTLAAMAKSQVDMIDQLSMIKEKTEAGEAKAEELEKMYQSTYEKLTAISDSISHLSYAKQLEDLKSNLDLISSDIQKLGAAITSETPELRENINSVKSELADLKKKMSDVSLLGDEIKAVEGKLANVEAMLSKKEEKAVAELGPSDKKAISELSHKLVDLSNEVKKMEKAFETYPSSDAQGLTSIRQKLDDIDEAVDSLKEGPHQDVMGNVIDGLREKINSLEKMFEEKEFDMEKKREAEMRVLTDLLKRIEAGLEAVGGQKADQLSQALSELNEKTMQMAASLQKADIEKKSPTYFSELRTEVSNLGARLGRIEDYFKKEKVADSSHVTDIRTEIRAIRRELENMSGMKVKPEAVSKVREGITKLDVSATKVIAPQEKEKIKAIKSNISKTREALKPAQTREAKEVKKGLQSAEEKVSGMLKEMGKMEEGMVEKREVVKQLRSEVLGAPLRSEDVVSNYLSKLSSGLPIRVKDIALILNMNMAEVMRILVKMQSQEATRLVLKNTGYVSKLLRKEPTVTKLE